MTPSSQSALALVAALALAGCAGSVRTVEPAAGLAAVAGAVAGRTATVVLRDGSRHRGRSLALAPDTTSWVDADTGEGLLAPTAAVAEVRLYNRGRSTARTAGAGTLIGGGAGMLFGAALCDGECLGLDLVVSTLYAGMGAMAGAVAGAIGGADANRPDRYVFAPADGPYRGDLLIRARPGPPPAGPPRR